LNKVGNSEKFAKFRLAVTKSRNHQVWKYWKILPGHEFGRDLVARGSLGPLTAARPWGGTIPSLCSLVVAGT